MGEETFTVRAAMQDAKPVPEENLVDRAAISLAEMNQKIQGSKPARTEDNRVWIPILADSGLELLGIIEVDEGERSRLSDTAMDALASFALQAAVAVTDAQGPRQCGQMERPAGRTIEIG